ncbi:MAG TPA: hypothetical protein VNO22_10290 [Planctomycetota bacterium]|nr:hypothetical protein [Planctomycetota bacterium]
MQLRRAGQAAQRELAARELRRIALACPERVAQEILRKVREEHRQTTELDRALIKDVRNRGGVCFPGGMTLEEWRNRLPRALHGRKTRCVPADELAQEFYDRGIIPDASTDTVLDHLGKAYERARSKPPVPEERELVKEARRVVREKVNQAVRELVRTARREGEASCPPARQREPGEEG